jgi:hypothetical protein
MSIEIIYQILVTKQHFLGCGKLSKKMSKKGMLSYEFLSIWEILAAHRVDILSYIFVNTKAQRHEDSYI